MFDSSLYQGNSHFWLKMQIVKVLISLLGNFCTPKATLGGYIRLGRFFCLSGGDVKVHGKKNLHLSAWAILRLQELQCHPLSTFRQDQVSADFMVQYVGQNHGDQFVTTVPSRARNSKKCIDRVFPVHLRGLNLCAFNNSRRTLSRRSQLHVQYQ